jgi:hypothetical protein
MTTIIPSPFKMKDTVLKIAADNYEKTVSTAELVPTSTVSTWKGLSPDAIYPTSGNTSWVCNLGYAQDWSTPGSLSSYLFRNAGKTVSMDLFPLRSGSGFRFSVLIVEGSIGGAIDADAVATVSLMVVGRPIEIKADGTPVVV